MPITKGARLHSPKTASRGWSEQEPVAHRHVAAEAWYKHTQAATVSSAISEWRVVGRLPETARPAAIERSDQEVQRLFGELASEWREATVIESRLDRIVMHRSYQRIIGLGPQVVPYILADLQEAPNHWFWALIAIVGEDMAADQTSLGAAAEAWLAWGRNAGLIED